MGDVGSAGDLGDLEQAAAAHGEQIQQALQGELLPGVVTRFVSIPTLIAMKYASGRPRDLDDIEHLRLLQKGSHR